MSKKIIAWIVATVLTFLIGLWPIGLIIFTIGGVALIIKHIACTAAKEVYEEQRKTAHQIKTTNSEADFQRWKAERESREG